MPPKPPPAYRSELDRLMAEEGVTPLGQPAPRPSRPQAPAAPRPSPPPAAARAPRSDLAEALHALEQARARIAALEPLTGALAAKEAELQRLRATLALREAEQIGLTEERDAARAEAEAARRRLDQATAARQDLQRQLDAVPAAASLAALLTGRDLRPAEHAEVLAGLAVDFPEALRDAIQVAPAAPLAQLLEERVALTCGDPSCAPGGGVVHVQVEPARCEVCGGSDIARAFQGLLDACRQSPATPLRLLIVGGSPSYRTQLDALARPHRGALRLDFIDGKAKQRVQRVRDRVRGADLVVIWGATIMDHATSAAVESAGGATLAVRERGITRMLAAVAAALERGGVR
ncbi:MAG: hypothetical protein H6739_19585 [Alphaproteobacteria bacterium]|nr:hypothetical protein [Alphaproteobacteria bacterium]